jgi:hypothetical protein
MLRQAEVTAIFGIKFKTAWQYEQHH